MFEFIILVLVIAVAVILGIILSQRLRYRRELDARATLDYNSARGTQHLIMVRNGIAQANAYIAGLIQRRTQLQDTVDRNRSSMETEIYRQYSSRVFKEHFDDIEGIGKAFHSQISDKCFDGTLESLYNARTIVPNIGYNRQVSINEWIYKMKAAYQDHRKSRTREILAVEARYNGQNNELMREIEKINTDVIRLQAMVAQAQNGITQLSTVTIDDFKRICRDKIPSERVDAYLVGIFSEWDEPPQWFTNLLTVSERVPSQ